MKRMMLAWLIVGSLPISAIVVNGSGFDGSKDMDFGLTRQPVAVSYPGESVVLPAYTQCSSAIYVALYQKAVETDVRVQLYQYLRSINKPVIWETMKVVGSNSSVTWKNAYQSDATGNGLSFKMTGVDGTLLLAYPEYSHLDRCIYHDGCRYHLAYGTALNVYQTIPLSAMGNYASTICSMDAVVDAQNYDGFGDENANGTWVVQNDGNPSTKSPATGVVIGSLKIHFHQATCLGACSANPAR